MSGLGYEAAAAGKTGGSRRRFISKQFGPIILHKPHAGTVLKDYQIAQVATFLKVHGIVKG